MTEHNNFQSGYSSVNGLQMYYEVYGVGKPLVLIHGGGSTIQTSFGRLIPELAKSRQLIAVELQAHGRTSDRDAPLTFAQDADDVASLLQNLQIAKADFLGFSNGGQTAIEIALRHPQLVNKLVLCSTFYKLSAVPPPFWKGFEGNLSLSNMPQPYHEAYLAVNNNPAGLQNMFDKDVQRMRNFKDWTDEQIASIQAPTLVMNGTKDVGSPEHAVEMYRTLSNSELAILPGGHGTYLGEVTTLEEGRWTQAYAVPLIEDFLDKAV